MSGLYGNKFLQESALNKITMGFKIKPHQNIDETFKKHKYEGLLNFAKKCNDIDDLKYLQKDLSISMHTFAKIRDRIVLCVKKGECKETQAYYKNIKKKYIDNDISAKDIDLTIEWFKNVYSKEISKRIKELK